MLDHSTFVFFTNGSQSLVEKRQPTANFTLSS